MNVIRGEASCVLSGQPVYGIFYTSGPRQFNKQASRIVYQNSCRKCSLTEQGLQDVAFLLSKYLIQQ